MPLRTKKSSGLPNLFELTVEESFFTKDPGYMSGESLLIGWKGPTEAREDGIAADTDQSPIYFSCGKGWESHDGGETAEHPKEDFFHDSSVYGKVIAAAGEELLDASGEVIKLDVAELVAANGDEPREAKMWVGGKFLMERRQFDYGKLGVKEHLIPVEFLGMVGGSKSAAPSDAKAKAAAAKAKAAAKKKGGGLREQVEQIAKESEEYSVFYERALEVDGITDDDDLLTEVVDESDEGLYAKVKAG